MRFCIFVMCISGLFACENSTKKAVNDKRVTNKITTQGVLANWSGLNDSYETSLKLKDID